MNRQLIFIGILGYGGAVGRTAVEYLYGKYFLRCGQRSKKDEFENSNLIEYVQVDIFKEKELMNFCSGCDIVLNCAGPSYLIGDRVAKAAHNAGAKYIDAFGADYLEEAIKEYDGTFILSAGSFPGLSGILPRWLAINEKFDDIDNIEIFAGGEEKCSKGAVADLILSSIKGFGVPNGYYKDGIIYKNNNIRRDKVDVLGFEKMAFIQEYINKETIRLANLLNIEEAHWYNIQVNRKLQKMMSKACIRLLVDNNMEILDSLIDEIMLEGNKEKYESWYTISIKMSGKSCGEVITKNMVLKSDNSYKISGLICALVVEEIAKNRIEEGIYWAFEILDPKITVDTLLNTKIINSIEVIDDVEENDIEEGVL
ncbi:saccharopine dehydrogenase NADP-binding domain-containing protein [Clostridium sp. LCP25S3_F10]|uniref:saccharopine dehydrogenase NADP-binding domain-containing protein n=1 Tax=Clostridium sp. LCP25S3_F10 TaxID=3438750 RepID=UPI003F8F91B5